MKISSASKKVLASALSAAMVVAFAPTVAFGKAWTGTTPVTVHYDVNGGTGTPMIQRKLMFEANQSVRVSTARPTREGYSFIGWSLSRGGEVQFMPGDAITLDEDILLYAVWDAVSTADLPQTGDTSRPAAWLALLGACCAGLWCVSRRRG